MAETIFLVPNSPSEPCQPSSRGEVYFPFPQAWPSLCDFPDNQNAVEVTYQASEARLEKVILFCLALSTDALGTSHHAVSKPRPQGEVTFGRSG